jgi:hypothetical protein
MRAVTKTRKPGFYASLSAMEVEHLATNLEIFRQASSWVANYLTQSHPKLGRTGAVCPFAQSALNNDTIRIAVVRLDREDKRVQIKDAIEYHLKEFLAYKVPKRHRMLQSTLILFPDVRQEEASELIDQTKEMLKPEFIKLGLMLGEFHAQNNSPGLHNSEFTPLRSPVPMLAIRRMVSTDLSFLDRPEYDSQTRLKYLEAYLSVGDIPQNCREQVERNVALLKDRGRCPYAHKS